MVWYKVDGTKKELISFIDSRSQEQIQFVVDLCNQNSYTYHKEGSDRILGATIVARHAGEMISEVTCAMTGKMGLGTLAYVMHPYPTQAEAIRAVGDLYNRTRLTPSLKNLFIKFLAWRR